MHMDDVDDAVKEYLRALLSGENQLRIADAMRSYRAGKSSRMLEFKQAVKKRIDEKQAQYDALMQNLASGSLPAEVVADIGTRMQVLKDEIASLEATEPPKDFSPDMIQSWLEHIKAAPDEKAIHLLVDRIDVESNEEKTVVNVQSTLMAVLGENGCGGQI